MPPSQPDWLQALDVLVWPLVAVAALVALFTPAGRAVVRPLIQRIHGFKAFGVELDFTESSATEVRESLEDAFKTYRADVQGQFDRLTRQHNIDSLRGQVLSAIRRKIKDQVWHDFRCTIHVQDLLFSEALYQLLDYAPTGQGRGRVFPVRFGILGKAWRAGKSQAQGQVSTDPGVLIFDWGMTSEEATAAGRGRKSFACVVLRDENRIPVGVLYFDSNHEYAFGKQAEMEQFVEFVEDHARECGLTGALQKLVEEGRKGGPQVRMFDRA